jgi:cytochrome P450
VIVLTTHADAKDAYRQRDLRQALYDEGERLMHGVIVNLHGQAHLDRRRLENRLFRRDTFTFYERDIIPTIIHEVMAPAVAAGAADLLPLARRTMMTLSLDVAGIDRRHRDGPDAQAEIDRLYHLMDRLARASTVSHATGDKAAIIADGDAEHIRHHQHPRAAKLTCQLAHTCQCAVAINEPRARLVIERGE